MKSVTETPHTAASPPAGGSAARTVALNALIWLGICALGTATSYQDQLRQGRPIDLLGSFGHWVYLHVPLFLMSSGLLLALRRRPERVASPRDIGVLFVALTLVYFPLHMAFIALPGWWRQAGQQGFAAYLLGRDAFTWFIEYAWSCGAFAVVIAVHVWRLGQQRTNELRQAQTANLQLQLSLEQQRLASMRQQLEPHFIFNALNAISALVRANEQNVALDGIEALSDLLRYTLVATRKDWVLLGEELRFCRDYLDLQQLRYRERLSVRIEGLSDAIEAADCPPLLLQPLIENALRHELDCHDQASELRLHFALAGERLAIRIWNPIHDRESRNPGLGLGLTHTRARLAMMYRGAAQMSAGEVQDGFEVRLDLPARRPE